uniref:Uncharacterized protein n=1 Tax=Asterionellopsis glacialis TaxID=33640 RepID=A0A6T9YB54_9STRA
MKNFNPLALGFLVAPKVNSEVLTTTRVLVIQPPPPLHHEMNLRPPPTAIERDCTRDVDYLCSENPFGVPMTRMQDPMLDWIMQPSAPLPILDTTPLDQMLNDMMNSIISMPPPMLEFRPSEENHEEKPHQVVDDVFHSMLTSLAEHVAESSASADEPEATETTSEEKGPVTKETARTSGDDSQAYSSLPPPPPVFDPIQFTKQLAGHGHQILEKEENEDKRRLARRLTEVEPDMFRQSYGHLPFGCHKNRCLINALEHGKTSPKCAATLRQSQQAMQEQMVTRKIKSQQVKDEQETFVAMVYIYGLLVIGTMILVVRRLHLTHSTEKRRLKVRILQLVYNRPELKSQIEKELGENLGSVPPFHPFFLAGMGAGARERIEHWKQLRMVRFVVWVGLAWMAIVNPLLAMVFLILMMGAQFLKLLCCPRKLKEDCTCCYCGLSTADVQTGVHTDCHVCNGTGVCAPTCDRCCNDEKDEDEEEQQECYRQTGDDGTIPPPPGTRRRGTIKKATEQAYMGIPVQVV